MYILIDGYNVLKQALGSKQISESQRRAFIAMLGRYAARKNHTVTVIFDGGPDTWSTRQKDHGIVVVYSGIKQSADDLIKTALEQRPHVLLVTSDNELKASAGHGTTVMNSLDFYTLVKEELAPPEKVISGVIIKTSKEENPFIDELMRSDTQKIYKGSEQEDTQRRSHGQTPSKKERAFLQKLKKL